MKKRRIAVVTGIRSEYHILESVMRAIEAHPKLELRVVVTGTHLSPKFGSTWKLVARDFPIAAKVPSLLPGDSLLDRARSLGRQTEALARRFHKLQPDIVAVLGDREESLATAGACAYLNIACAHISGGDRSRGTVDDLVRHSVTKLAHLHFPTTSENAIRIVKMGEEPWRVKAVGASGLDRLRAHTSCSRADFLSTFGLSDQDFVLVIQHPVSSQVKDAAAQMRLTLEAIRRSKLAAVIVHPNSDAGSRAMIREIQRFKKPGNWAVRTTLDGWHYTNALRHARAMVGNSSAGLLEAPFMACPAINVGLRQSERTAGPNLIRVPHSISAILGALKKAASPAYRRRLGALQCRHLYGDGHTGIRIAQALAKVPLGARLLNKPICY